MDLYSIRKTIITAVASDDVLVERLVLKGGNALEIVHKIGGRASLDLDFSMEGDFENPDDIGRRLHSALKDRFDSAGFLVFDYKFAPRPSAAASGEKWGGYNADFKLISRVDAHRLNHDINAMRIQSHVVGDATQKRVFSIEISKYEYCQGKELASVDSFDCFVYTPIMIAAEKLRAICQQMPEYTQRKHPAPRPRDFYDIHSLVTNAAVDLTTGVDLIEQMFAAKEVPLPLLRQVESQREFHRQGWSAVQNAVKEQLKPFDFYYDFVLAEVDRLKAIWNP